MHEIRGPKLLTKGRNSSFEKRRKDAAYRKNLDDEMAKHPPDVPLDMVLLPDHQRAVDNTRVAQVVTMFKQRMQSIMMQVR